MSRALLDTSVVIAIAQGEEIPLPDEVAISTVTLCGLHHGVLAADESTRPARLATLVQVERTMSAIPVDARVAPHYGKLVSEVRRRTGRKLRTADALIAATAISHGLSLLTRDSDFDGIELDWVKLV
ncbi:MAG: PIN domain-containing protein [Solirubrobacterales bacterium]|nr:PIN domain-containing protein [Solirubrobacterales bacterium]MCB8969184.1 PIN domain-containing protein [Thermoleophilales bacterium]MCO5328011.1 PIN domain-containing protein [Solirubrobacterales bacterium]